MTLCRHCFLRAAPNHRSSRPVCIKNDTANVLIENVVFQDGHGASIGSIPDCSGCHGVVTNITFRNLTFAGDAPMKIKWWANTTVS